MLDKITNKRKSTLVVGADSLIGNALISHLRNLRTDEKVIGTTRRLEGEYQRNYIHFDLLENTQTWRKFLPIDTAVICASVTKLEICDKNPEASAHINVEGTIRLIKNLIREGVFVVYLSTNRVFDGLKPNCRSEEQFYPTTEYGRQKSEVEKWIIREGTDSIVTVRLTKVLAEREPLFLKWITALKQGENIYPFEDLFMAPVPLSCIVTILELVKRKKLSGILQVSGEEDVSYADVARRGALLAGADLRQICPVKIGGGGLRSGTVSLLHTTLNIDRLKIELGITPPDVWKTIERAFYLICGTFQ